MSWLELKQVMDEMPQIEACRRGSLQHRTPK